MRPKLLHGVTLTNESYRTFCGPHFQPLLRFFTEINENTSVHLLKIALHFKNNNVFSIKSGKYLYSYDYYLRDVLCSVSLLSFLSRYSHSSREAIRYGNWFVTYMRSEFLKSVFHLFVNYTTPSMGHFVTIMKS